LQVPDQLGTCYLGGKVLSQETEHPTKFYGWFVVGACFAATFTLGEAMWTFGVFFKPLENEFGWSRAVVSSGYTVFLIAYAFSAIITGRLSDRYSPRPILFVSALLAGIGTSLCSLVQDINQLRIFLFIAGLGAGATFSVPTSVVQRWFYRRSNAGLALAIVVSGVGIGALAFAPLINYLILSYGWRNTYLIAGILYLLIIVTSSLVIKPSPVQPKKIPAGQGVLPNAVNMPRWTTAKALTTHSFIGVAFITVTVILAFQVLTVHLVPHATDAGISPTVSAAALGLLGGLSVPGRIFSGFMAERIRWQMILALSCFGMALSFLWLLFLERAWVLYCFVCFYGICHGLRVPANVGILGEFFGVHSLGELTGIVIAIGTIIGAFAPFMVGFIFDALGSYSVAFIIVIAFLLTSGIVACSMKRPGAQAEPGL
jgi:MFS family permease